MAVVEEGPNFLEDDSEDEIAIRKNRARMPVALLRTPEIAVRYSDLVSKITGYEMRSIGSLCDDLTRKYVINRWHRSSANAKPVLNTLEITFER
ncbi:hypothetical protein V1477_016116 [Vespula maculifrons]|uniref:Uncharacterized protein n=2 Tax=Vespula TaxID=7451 RepID=A0A834K5I8_VESVU|nr:hypothetical protein HZH66_006656 [Vespula vulgaris]